MPVRLLVSDRERLGVPVALGVADSVTVADCVSLGLPVVVVDCVHELEPDELGVPLDDLVCVTVTLGVLDSVMLHVLLGDNDTLGL